VGTDSASIRGVVNPEGAATTVYVEYGKGVPYSSKSASQTVPAGLTPKDVLFQLSGLSLNTLYHYRVFAIHETDKKSGAGADKTFKTKAVMQLAPATHATTATSKGVVPVTLSCTGNVLRRCSGTVFLEANGLGVGSKSFSLMPNKRTVVPVKLTPKGLKLLMRKKRLRLVVTITASDGNGGLSVYTYSLTVAAPVPAKHRVVLRRK
jgi:hypothetical protein